MVGRCWVSIWGATHSEHGHGQVMHFDLYTRMCSMLSRRGALDATWKCTGWKARYRTGAGAGAGTPVAVRVRSWTWSFSNEVHVVGITACSDDRCRKKTSYSCI